MGETLYLTFAILREMAVGLILLVREEAARKASPPAR
jgi:hypothetical protein